MEIFAGYLMTYIYVFILLAVTALLSRFIKLSVEATRKIVHICCCFAWFIMYYTFETTWHLLIPPLTFVILNYISYKKNTFKAMERSDKASLGTVYYPISMVLMSAATVFYDEKFMLPYGMAIICLSLGDGLAPFAGSVKKGNVKLIFGKTLFGTITVFAVSLVIIAAINSMYSAGLNWYEIIAVSAVGTLLELVGTRGLDNIFMPLGISALSYIFIIF